METTYQYVLDLHSRLDETAKLAVSHAEISGRTYKAYDRNTKALKLKVGG